ncbi:cysteine proteinase [Sodiomyces alkalinus F11]|uniref:ubiquitinyl hydrolase 1 n=1 Tax=Sodiomyces alkalinus (strain CBS 110278 / VKM F-3762 / F11) TaxID=1314773 RepID=A0A3N2PJS7_SODAK|nr:cysteine proteinase [Sodiomyces alkalinus F11]ROT34566.1 cysteine proteinase [Sodiomyces alkalinus F11]
MNSQRAHSALYNDPYSSKSFYAGQDLKDRLLQPTVLVSIAALLVTSLLWTSSARLDILWDAFVFVVPYRALYTIDNLLHPPLVPRPMLQGPARTHAAKSALMQRVLGFDRPGGGVMGTVTQAGQRGLASFSGAMMALKGGSDRPPGLGNLDNSCYQNSILQGLASLKPLPRYLSDQLRHIELDAANQKKYHAAVTLRTLIADLNDASNHGRTLWTPGSLKNMSTWQQQDAQEYYSKLLDEIDREIVKAAQSNNKNSLPRLELKAAVTDEPTSVDDTTASQHSDDSGYQSISVSSTTESSAPSVSHNPLEGLVAQRVACVQCGHCDGLSMIPFNCLTLSLGLNSAEHDLFELLDAYAHIESIEGVECGKCTLLKMRRLLNTLLVRERASGTSRETMGQHGARMAAVEDALDRDDFEDKTITDKCQIPPNLKVTSTKTKQTVIARPPQSLVIHMNRSAFDENTGYMWKNSAAVRFPLLLDLGPWCLGSAGTFKRVDDQGEGEGEGQGEGEGKGPLPVVVPAHPDREEWLLRPRVSMVAGDRGQSKITGPFYELRAVITHYGRHENGHYVCYRKFPRSSPPKATKPMEAAKSRESVRNESEEPGDASDQDSGNEAEAETEWWRLSDDTVYKVDEETVLAQGGVFMLFYDCVDPASALTSQVQVKRGAGARRERHHTVMASSEKVLSSSPGEEAMTGNDDGSSTYTSVEEEVRPADRPEEAATPVPQAESHTSGKDGPSRAPPASDANSGTENVAAAETIASREAEAA